MNAPRLFHVNAFTSEPFRGNPAGVVLDADGLSAQQMQLIARDLRHSETAFVMAPTSSDCDVHVRFFTPTTEVPICGHATIAAHYVRASLLGVSAASVRQRSAAGVQTIHVEAMQGDLRVAMEQGPVQFEPPLAPALIAEIAAALRLDLADIDEARPVQVVSTGHSKVILPLRRQAALDAIEPDMAALTRLSARIGCNGYFPFVILPGEYATEGRMFAPAIGIPEDPVTGNANGPLGAYLVQHGLMAHSGKSLCFRGHQGRHLGREGVVEVHVEIEHERPAHVVVSGRAVALFDTVLNLP